MTVLSALLALFGQLMNDVATATVGWAVVLLFGRVPQARQSLLAGIGLGSLVWLTALVAVAFPPAGDAIVSAIPRPPFVGRDWLSTAILATAILLPLAIGLATVAAVPEDARPRGAALAFQVLRGYPYALVLGLTILFLAAVRLVRRVRSLQLGWRSDQLAFIVKEGQYEAVAADLEAALREAGLPVQRRRTPRVVEVPPRLVALVGGPAVRAMVPDRLVEFDLDGLGILLFPSGAALLGEAELVARARAVIARRLTFAHAYLTLAKESEQIEDRLAAIADEPRPDPRELAEIDVILGSLVVPYADWQTLYRLRLQVEHEDDERGIRSSHADALSRATTRPWRGPHGAGSPARTSPVSAE